MNGPAYPASASRSASRINPAFSPMLKISTFIPALRNRECIISGEGVTTPVRVRFDSLDEARAPGNKERSRKTGGGDGFGNDVTTRHVYDAEGNLVAYLKRPKA